MPPKEPTRHQLSSRLSYSQDTPLFLRRIQNRIAGIPDEEQNDEFEDGGLGRPPIPRRPAIPERPDDDEGSAGEDDDDEKPQVVVLKEGKHLTEREAEDVRRKEAEDSMSSSKNSLRDESKTQSLSFASSRADFKLLPGKRKAVGHPEDGKDDGKSNKGLRRKAKKPRKALLSFSDDT